LKATGLTQGDTVAESNRNTQVKTKITTQYVNSSIL